MGLAASIRDPDLPRNRLIYHSNFSMRTLVRVPLAIDLGCSRGSLIAPECLAA
jgi:hypothetical protein